MQTLTNDQVQEVNGGVIPLFVWAGIEICAVAIEIGVLLNRN